MRIAFYHQLHKGGARRGTNEFARQLKMRGHEVDLYTIGKLQEEEKKIYSNIFLYKFKPKKWKGHDWKTRLYKDSIELFRLYLLDKKIAADIEKRKYNAAYIAASFFIESPFVLQFLKLPTFFYCNDPYYRIIYEPDLFKRDGLEWYKVKYEGVNRFVRKYLDKWNISKASYIISISSFCEREFYRAYGRKGDVVYYGVDTKFFVPRYTDKNIDLLFIGSYDFLDGYPFFEEVIKNMKSKPKTRIIIFENEWLNDKQLLDVYQRTKVLVAPAYREPLGLVPLEAMACGAAVIAVNEGAHPETVINNKTGYVLKRDPKLFARNLDELLNNPDTLRKMGKNASIYVQDNWSWEKRGKELEDFILGKLK